jgi:hypothetical protein
MISRWQVPAQRHREFSILNPHVTALLFAGHLPWSILAIA